MPRPPSVPSVLAARRAALALLAAALVAGVNPARGDEKTKAAALADLLPDGALARIGTPRLRHPGAVEALAFSADGRLLASAGADGAHVWDAATGKEVRSLIPDVGIPGRGPAQNYVFAVAFSPDGKALATDARDQSVRLWGLATGKEARRLDGPTNGVNSLVFSPDGKSIAGGGNAATLRVWDAASGKLSAELKYDPPGPVRAVAFGAGGKTVIARVGKDVVVRETDGGKEVLRVAVGFGPVALSADGKRLARGPGGYAEKGAIRLFDAVKSKALDITLEGHKLHVLSLAFAPDGKSLAAVSADNTIRLWDVETKKELRRFQGQPDWVRVPLAFSPDGKTLAAGSQRGTITVWDVTTGKLRDLGETHVGFPLAAALSPDGKSLVTADFEAVVRLWDVATGKFVRRLGTSPYAGGASLNSSLRFTPDGRTVVQVFGVGRGGAALWDVATGKEVLRLDAYAAILSPDGKTLAAAEGDGRTAVTVRLLDAGTGKERRRLEGAAGRVQQLAFSADGKALTAFLHGQAAPLVCSWDVATGKERHEPRTLAQLWYGPAALAGRLLVVSDSRNGLHVYDLVEREERRTFPGPFPALSPDGRLLASVGPNFTVVVREVATGLERRRFPGHAGTEAMSLTFAADGRRLLSTGNDGSVLVWDVTGRQEKGRLKPEALTAERCEALWDDLASADGGKAGRAVWALVGDPKAAVPFLREHLKPVSPDGKRPKQLVEDLDSDDLATRRNAFDELGKLGALAGINLRRALEQKPSLDATRRINELLGALQPGKAPAPGWVRAWRALEVLEAIGTPEARKVVGAMAEGAKPAELTRAAKEIVERMAAP